MKKLFTVAAAMVLGTSAFAQNASFPLEANGGYINFHDDSPFKDTYYYGGATGFNFSETAGIRGYYWKALQNEELKKNDHLEIYGVETKVKAPISDSFMPYLVVGGGLLKPYGDYTASDNYMLGNVRYTEDKFFGSAGAGIDLEFIDFLSITGYARAMVTEFDEFDNLGNKQDTEIKPSWNYGGSVNFNIGGNSDGKIISSAKGVNLSDDDRYISNPKDRRIAELEERLQSIEEKSIRDKEIEELRKELRQEFEGSKSNIDSYDTNRRLEDQIKSLENRVSELNKIQAKQKAIIEDTKDAYRNSSSTDGGRTIIVTDGNDVNSYPSSNNEPIVVGNNNSNSGNGFFSGMSYNATEIIGGAQFGDETSGVFGVRPDWKMNNDKLRLLGELSANLADETGINIFANLATDFAVGNGDAVSPYFGLGAGVTTVNSNTDAAFNMLVGTKINSVLDGKLTAQYDTRNFFDYNQLTVGYRIF